MEDSGFALSSEDLIGLAERASWPDERGRPPFEASAPGGADPEADALFARWRELVAKGNDEAFRRVLEWRGIDQTRWRESFRRPRLAPGAVLPPWVAAFAGLMAAAGTAESAPVPAALGRVPWAALFTPFVAAVSGPLRERCATSGIAPDVAAGLEVQLILGLCEVAGPALAADSEKLPELNAAIALGNPPQSWKLLPGGVAGFFRRYPVLARLITLRIDAWQAMLAEFLDRLAADGADIRARFFNDADPGRLVSLDIENADAHDGGRIPMLLTFEGGGKLVYKPRSLVLDVRFAELVAWLEARGLALAIRVPRVLDRATHGWAEFITYRRAEDTGTTAGFYRRAGALLALANAIGTTDLHCENLIADGSGPVPIDLETVLQPVPVQPTRERPRTTRQRLMERMASSILQTGMPPAWDRREGAVRFDVGGLGDPAFIGKRMLHRPTAGPIEPVLLRHAEDIATGFRDAYLGLMARKDELLAPDGPVAAMADTPVRVLLRDTRTYAGILRRTLAADAVGDGAAYEIGLERLARVLCAFNARPPLVPLVPAEKSALRRLDIPRFAADTNSLAIADGNGVVASGILAMAALDRARERLAALSPRDLEVQLQILRLALQARIAQASVPETNEAAPTTLRPRFAPSQPTALARCSAERIEAARIDDGEPVAAWLSLARESLHDPFGVAVADPSLAHGVAGVALLYAALVRIEGGEAALARFAAALVSLREFADRARTDFYRPLKTDIGIANGYGGLAYALATMSRIVEREDIIDLAVEYALAIEPSIVAAETNLDIHSGLAGAVLGIAAVYRLRPEPAIRDRLRDCGERLVAAASASALRELKPLGLLGGPAGIALAALRLCDVLALPGAEALAREALQLETETPAGGWSDGNAGVLLVGIAAAEARLLPMPDGACLANVADAVVQDDLVSGRAGVADLLCEAGRRLADPDLIRRGEMVFDTMMARSPDSLRLFRTQLPHAAPIGLFNGLAGIGYQSLRRVAPGALPFLLLFD